MKALKANSLQLDDWITLKNEENYLGKILLNKKNETPGEPLPPFPEKKIRIKI